MMLDLQGPGDSFLFLIFTNKNGVTISLTLGQLAVRQARSGLEEARALYGE
ncbi:MAG: hypothetical protein PHV13_02990 [Candidatus ainarchaeum sp.]|nr:hypothetical protein [Candidatus ainarchaeum sp.]